MASFLAVPQHGQAAVVRLSSLQGVQPQAQLPNQLRRPGAEVGGLLPVHVSEHAD